MKVLWASARKLLPLDTGAKIRSYNIMRELAKRYRFTLLSYYWGKLDGIYEREIASHFPGTIVIHAAAAKVSSVGRVFHYIRQASSRIPYAVTKFTFPEVRSTLTSWMTSGQCDVVVCDFLCVSLNFPLDPVTPTVLFQHNVETELWRRKAIWERNPFKKLIFEVEASKMAHYEAKVLKRFDHIVAVSERDRQEMSKMIDSLRITVVPTGVDLHEHRAIEGCGNNPPTVIFTGSMDWDPNIDGVIYFCKNIWPLVRAAVPNVRFWIVGRNPHPLVRKLASDSVRVTGNVPSVAEYLEKAQVVVVPLRLGGGTRLKIYEAMAKGKAVVSTSVGAEGLDVHAGLDIMLGDEPEIFAEHVVNLLRDEKLRARYGSAAYQLVQHYTWPAVAQRFAEVLEQTVYRMPRSNLLDSQQRGI